ncbi:Endonuclease, Uma2 family (restriction endonuclease fold) [Actinopolyspora xinjiangensis]|uniref:Endonuclease, Uma2 family (Restriction endonuclease fold) n=1 Tax=Actinopolyspora xinjiangensis TaxID=405564 RepID=A0A1H0V627_9ACTN|nr:Uma2 family endonuclease [Actinopolyspora xinjiangensis]SDP74012.1 Endonuclease, Uma2 family (restriction endonuclease fold) [Actinopolyspora xinjiangensis]
MSTVVAEGVIPVAAPAHDTGAFDPLVELRGVWTPDLADRYLPIPGMPPVKYECQDGHLIVSPYEGSANTYAAYRMLTLMEPPARGLGCRVYPTLNVQLGINRWIQPDFAVLREPALGRVWIPATQALLVGECVSPSSRVADRIDKPAMCAEAGIEYFMRVEVSYAKNHAEITLLRLGDEGVYEVHAKALAGDTFETREPFPLSFDPAELLED